MKSSELFLSIGSNLGDRRRNLLYSISLIEERIGIVQKQSSIIETEPWGFSSDNAFLNMAIQVNTKLDVSQVLSECKSIECDMGRIEKSKDGQYYDRIIDLDLLFFDNLIVDTKELTLPHPKMEQRLFVLKPLAEIAPDMVHPIYLKSVKQLLFELENGR